MACSLTLTLTRGAVVSDSDSDSDTEVVLAFDFGSRRVRTLAQAAIFDPTGTLEAKEGNPLHVFTSQGAEHSYSLFEGGGPARVFGVHFSPDSRFLTFIYGSVTANYGDINVVDTATRTVRQVTRGLAATDAAWRSTGGLVVQQTPYPGGATEPAFYVTTPDLGSWRKVPLDVRGMLGGFAVSPDGRLIAWSARDENDHAQVWVAGLDGTGARQLTNTLDDHRSPQFSPDGKQVAYADDDKRHVYKTVHLVGIDGTGDRVVKDRRGKPVQALWMGQWVPAGLPEYWGRHP